ncbi:MAG: extracellular solute-binding protein, partial [Anaerolineales bacterium]|nr:extracellular solute-binding protein [Anaerolineales bacterium]
APRGPPRRTQPGAAALAEPAQRTSLTLWVNETSPAHAQVVNDVVAAFEAAYPAAVEVRLVAPALLPRLMETAAISDSLPLPDLVLHPVAYTAGWVAQGILDAAAADTAVSALDPATFDADALALVTVDGQAAAIPSDGYQQLILYRTDWFADRGMAPPDTYDALLAAAETLYDRENLVAGFVVPTESNLVTTQQIFEQLAVANGCQLIDVDGRVRLLEPACQTALDFYYTIIHNYSPIGVQTDTSTRNAYLFGRAGLVMTSPGILPQLAGLDPAALPTCAGCSGTFLADNTGILTTVRGSGPQAAPASLSNLTALGITRAAETETAVAFAEFWFENGYESWLRVETERKVPLRLGTPDAPRRFIDAWGSYPLAGSARTLAQLYGEEVVAQLRTGVASSDRWGLNVGQGSLITRLYTDLTLSVVLQEMLSGYFNPADTLVEAYIRVIDLIPNYAYDLDLEQDEP